VIVNLANDRRQGRKFQSRVVDVGSRDIDEIKEVCCKMEVVSCSMEKLIVTSYLVFRTFEHYEL
jgi:hypothetical protein